MIVVSLLVIRSVGATPPAPGVSPFWQAVAHCETGANWKMEGPIYEGGVGFAVSTWAMWAKLLGLYHQYPHAYLAPPATQARVAHYGLTVWRDAEGRHGYWGCLKHSYIRVLPGR